MGPEGVRMNHPFDSNNKDLAERWSQWQPDAPLHNDENAKPTACLNGARPASTGARYRFRTSIRQPKPFSLGDKLKDKAMTENWIAQELDTLQNLFYADKRYKLLVILQGTDIGQGRHHPGRVWPHGPAGRARCDWTAPNEEERAHDYLAHSPEGAQGG